MRLKTSFVILLFIVLWTVYSDADNSPAESKDCKFWHHLASNLSHAGDIPGSGFLQLACDSTCNSLTCSGHMKKMSMPIRLNLELDFCFGVRLNHCDDPVDMDYYLFVPDHNITKTGSISHNDTFEFPAVQQSKRLTWVVIVEMVRVNSSYILFGVTGKVKVRLIDNIDEFPYTEKVFPPTLIDVPPCTTKGETKPEFNPPQTCTPPTPAVTSTPSPVITATGKINSKTYNGSCEFGLESCGEHEMCRASENGRSKTGTCVCDTMSEYSPFHGLCMPRGQTQAPPGDKSTMKPPQNGTKSPVTASPSVTQANKTAKAGTNMTPVIIGAVFGGLLLIVVIVSVIIFIGRRRRLAILRGQHQLLMDNDDDDDRNMVI